MPSSPTVVDLFAGCGGLGLGLERAGFETILVNELHPDAMSTYLVNRPHSIVAAKSNRAINDVTEMTRSTRPQEIAHELRGTGRNRRDIGLVVGGPPCQGFSGIGHRRSFDVTKRQMPTNHLYEHMAEVVETLAPRAFLFENVKGLLTARWDETGDRGEIWEAVRERFRSIAVRENGKERTYILKWALVSSADYGVPQNRPRILLVGLRSDLAGGFSNEENDAIGSFLPEPLGVSSAPNLKYVLGDLVDEYWEPGGLTTRYPRSISKTSAIGKKFRQHHITGEVNYDLTDHQYSNHSQAVQRKFRYLIETGQVPSNLATRKFAQRVLPEYWGAQGPSITITSLPDDFVHFSQPRVPTVRESARIQTFPDSYVFEGKRTTGGRRRAGNPDIGDWHRDLPKFTQIGNAVPVTLAEHVGNHLRELIQ